MFASTATSITQAQAISLLDGDVCIWCEEAHKTSASHLCETCRVEDVDGLFGSAAGQHSTSA